jgi:hypothetical protein
MGNIEEKRIKDSIFIEIEKIIGENPKEAL